LTDILNSKQGRVPVRRAGEINGLLAAMTGQKLLWGYRPNTT
jgi:hypothetical protein